MTPAEEGCWQTALERRPALRRLAETPRTTRAEVEEQAREFVISASTVYRIASGNRLASQLAKPIQSILGRSYFAHMSEQSHLKIWQKGEIPTESHLFRYSDKGYPSRSRD